MTNDERQFIGKEFFENQHNLIIAARLRIEALDDTANGLLGVRLKSILPEIEKVLQNISDILPAMQLKDDAMKRFLTFFEQKLTGIKLVLRLVHQDKTQVEIRNEHIPCMHDFLNQLIIKLHNYKNTKI